MILIVDNYDSFTYNLVQRIGEIHIAAGVADPVIEVVRNDRITPEEAVALAPERVIISPGPCTPKESGVSPEIVRAFAGRVPLLGVCLGHQCIADVHEMPVERHTVIMHGKTSLVHHDGRGVFAGLSEPFVATRYHSLVVRAADEAVPAGFEISAWTFEDEADPATKVIMGLRRVAGAGEAPLEGVQFHPESFLTDEGPRLLANFLGLPHPPIDRTTETARSTTISA